MDSMATPVGQSRPQYSPTSLADLEDWIKGSGLPMEQDRVEHFFSPGIYVRKLFIPAGRLIIGKRHRHETMNMVMLGHLSVYMGPEQGVIHLRPPAIFTSPPMTKKMGYAHEDTVFVNVHPTDERDLDRIEEEFIITEEDYNQLNHQEGERLCLGQQLSSEEQQLLGA